jgi:hypothetical protein
MYVKSLIFAILLCIVPGLIKAQTYVYSYADPCTGNIKTINVPTNGVTVNYFGQMNTFSPADFTNGNFNNWANSVYSSFGGNNPCGSTIGISTSISMAQNTAMNVLGIMNTLDALSSMSGGGLNTNGVTESSKTESKSSKKNNKKNNSGGSTTGGTTGGSTTGGGTTGSGGTTGGSTTGSTSGGTTGGSTTGSTSGGTTAGSTSGGTTAGTTAGTTGGSTTGGETNGSTTGGTTGSTTGGSTTGSTTGGSTGGSTTGGSTTGSTTGGSTSGSTTGGSTTGGSTTGSTTGGSTTGGSTTGSTTGGTTGGSTTGGSTTGGTTGGSTTGGSTTGGTTGGSTTGETTTGGTTTGGTTGGSTTGGSTGGSTTGGSTTGGTTGGSTTGGTGTNGSGTGNSNPNGNSGSDAATTEEKKSSNILGGSIGSIQNSTSGNGSPTKGNAPTIVLSSDFAGFNFKQGDVNYGGKGTAGWTSLNWDGSRSHGFMLDYTSANKGPNFTAFFATIKKRRINLISVTGTTSFYGKGSLYGTVALGQMWSFSKVKNLKAIYMATSSYGNVYGTKFIGTAFIAGGMYDFKVGKRTQIKLTNLFIYAPYISYYNDMVLKSPYVIMPIIGTNIGVTKKFKLNVNFGGTYALGEDVLNFTVMMGTRFAL